MRDPQVDLIFSHFTPRYIATGVDPNDLERLKATIERWDDWCRVWSDEAGKHAQLGEEALRSGRHVTAAEVSCAPRSTITTPNTCSPTDRTNTAWRMTRCCAATCRRRRI
jgi:hypothetical protein